MAIDVLSSNFKLTFGGGGKTQNLKVYNQLINIMKTIYELAEEIKTIMTEKVFSARWELLECYHLVGNQIKIYSAESGLTINEVCNGIATVLGKSNRTLNYSVQFVDKFPDMQALPEGKNISWHKLVNNYLSEPKEKKEPETRCKHCKIHCPEGCA